MYAAAAIVSNQSFKDRSRNHRISSLASTFLKDR